jgi:predicted outer membrane repeat protein
MAGVLSLKIQRIIPIFMLIALLTLDYVIAQPQDGRPVADAGSSRYAASDPVQLDGGRSYDPDGSRALQYAWQQISGPSIIIADSDTPTPIISGFFQTDEIQECEFELIVSDGEFTSLPDTVKVIIVPDFGRNSLRHVNPPFNPNKPTFIFFGGGDCIIGFPGSVGIWNDPSWYSRVNVIDFESGYEPDPNYTPGDVDAKRTYYQCGDMIIVYLSSVAPDYQQPIQTAGWSTGGQTAIDVGIHLNMTYADARYAINRVTLLDARACRDYSDSILQFLNSSVDGEQCWIDNHRGNTDGPFHSWPSYYPNVLRVGSSLSHGTVPRWYANSLTYNDMNQFNHGIVGGAYWSVVGPGKNLQLASTPSIATYSFTWYGDESSGYLDFYDEPNHPGRLPEPITLIGPIDVGDPNGAVLTCEESENAIGYQLLFGSNPYRVMDYTIVSDTPIPPNQVITTLPFEETWWTVRAYDQFGSTIYADPVCTDVFHLSLPIKNLTKDKRYSYIQFAIDDAMDNDEIVLTKGIYRENIDFRGKNLTVRSTNPHDSQIVAATIIAGDRDSNLLTFSSGEDVNCVLAGFTITSGKIGIFCSGASPTITNCNITDNINPEIGAGICLKNGSNPTLINCSIINNSASMMGGGLYNENSNPVLLNCVFSGNSALYFGGGIYCSTSNPTITNCILWDNTPDEMFMFGSALAITYTDIKGGATGEGNMETDPLFADPEKGDYHLKSQAGRWEPISQSWIQDDVTSPCIDAGDPANPVAEEPAPNGNRINMGAYGGTSEASKSP